MGRHQAAPAEQAAWRAACERPARPQWHLLGLAVRCAMARSAGEFWAAHDLLQSLRSLAHGWRVGPDHECIERRTRCRGANDRHLHRPGTPARGLVWGPIPIVAKKI